MSITLTIVNAKIHVHYFPNSGLKKILSFICKYRRKATIQTIHRITRIDFFVHPVRRSRVKS